MRMCRFGVNGVAFTCKGTGLFSTTIVANVLLGLLCALQHLLSLLKDSQDVIRRLKLRPS